jgi:hypothetical protein
VFAAAPTPNSVTVTVLGMSPPVPVNPVDDCPAVAAMIPGTSSPNAAAAEIAARFDARDSASCPPAVDVEKPASAGATVIAADPPAVVDDCPDMLNIDRLLEIDPAAAEADAPLSPIAMEADAAPVAVVGDCPLIPDETTQEMVPVVIDADATFRMEALAVDDTRLAAEAVASIPARAAVEIPALGAPIEVVPLTPVVDTVD